MAVILADHDACTLQGKQEWHVLLQYGMGWTQHDDCLNAGSGNGDAPEEGRGGGHER